MNEVIAVEQLKQLISKIERLEEEKIEIQEALKEVFDEAKGNGFDVKAIKQVLKLKKADKAKLAEEEAIFELYKEALNL